MMLSMVPDKAGPGAPELALSGSEGKPRVSKMIGAIRPGKADDVHDDENAEWKRFINEEDQ